MDPTTGRTEALCSRDRLIRAVTLAALAAAVAYAGWRITVLGSNPWLSVPLFALELWGFTQLALLATQAWTAPPTPDPTVRGSAPVDLVVTCTFHSPEELEQTLVGCRTVDNANRTIVVSRAGRPEIAEVAARFDVELIEREGNHVDAFWAGVTRHGSTFAAWLEAGQVPMPDFIDALVGHFADPTVAIAQSGLGLLNRDSFAHLSGGRDEDAFRHHVAYPVQGARGMAPWMGGGSIVRTMAVQSAGGFDTNDQAALERMLVRLHAEGWISRYHNHPPLVRGNAPDSLGAYLMARRRSAIETLRVFRTPENPLTVKGLSFPNRAGHVALAAAYGNGVRQLGLVAILVATLLTGALPVGDSPLTWLSYWAPAFVLGVAARTLLARGTLRVGDWTRQSWRTLAADISALAAISGLRRRRVALHETAGAGMQALGKLRLLGVVLLVLDAAILARAATLIWPRLLPRFSASGRILTIGIGLIVLASVVDVLQVAVRRTQRRAQFRLHTDLVAFLGDTKVRVVDLAPTGLGAHLPQGVTPFASGHPVDVQLALPTPAGRRVIELSGHVRSTVSMSDRDRVGIEFGPLAPATRSALIEYCAIHHHTGGDAEVHLVNPSGYAVARSHRRTTQGLSASAVFFGIATLFLGPAAVPALADVAAPAQVCLVSSTGAPLEGAAASFSYDGEWHDLGSTGADGCVTGAMPQRTTTVAVVHEGARATLEQDLGVDPVVTFSTVPVTVAATTSTAAPLSGVSVEFHAGEWRPFGSTGDDGTVSREMLAGERTFAVTHRGIRNSVEQDTATDATVAFSTVAVDVTLASSDGAPLAGGSVEFYEGEWRAAGTTDASGLVEVELLPGEGTFRVTHAGIAATREQDVGANPTVAFATVATTVVLQDSGGEPIEGASAEYHAGEWRTMGATDADGNATVELLPGETTFAVAHDGVRVTRDQDTGVDPTIRFATVAMTVHLQDSTGDPIAGAPAEYHAGEWKDMGTTDADGNATVEVLPRELTYAVSHDGARATQEGDPTVTQDVVFTTIDATVILTDSEGEPLSGGRAEVYTDRWRSLGKTGRDGTASIELLPSEQTFRMTYENLTVTDQADLATSSVVEFATVPLTVRLHRSDGTPVAGGDVRYRSNGWRDLDSTDRTGTVTFEVMPATITVSMTDNDIERTQQVDARAVSTVTFTTVPVRADAGVEVTQFNSKGWKPFADDLELLAGRILVRTADRKTTTVTLVDGMVNFVPSGSTEPILELGEPTEDEPASERDDDVGEEIDSGDNDADDSDSDDEDNDDADEDSGLTLPALTTPTATPEPTQEPTATPRPTVTPTATATPEPTATAMPTAEPTATPTPSSPTLAATATPTARPRPTPTPGLTFTFPTATPSPTTVPTTEEAPTVVAGDEPEPDAASPGGSGDDQADPDADVDDTDTGEPTPAEDTRDTGVGADPDPAPATTADANDDRAGEEPTDTAPEGDPIVTQAVPGVGGVADPDEVATGAALDGPITQIIVLTPDFRWSTTDDLARSALAIDLTEATRLNDDPTADSRVEYLFKVDNTADADLTEPVVVELALDDVDGLEPVDQENWSCAAVGSALRCVHAAPMAAASSSIIRLTGEAPPAASVTAVLTVDGHSPAGDVAMVTVAVLALVAAINLPHRIARRRRG